MATIVGTISGWLYSYVLIILLIGVGIYFTIRLKGILFSFLKESVKVVSEKNGDGEKASSFQALMVSTASRVGTGNIVGVSTAVVIGGAGAMFWMWVIAILGGASAFIESTLAQIYKKKDSNSFIGGPAYYIEQALKKRGLGIAFAIMLILTYAVGFNMLASYNMQTSFAGYSFYNAESSPLILGIILAVLTGIVIFGGGKRIMKVTGVLVPIMAVVYVVLALIVLLVNIGNLPAVIADIFRSAFDFQSIFGGFMGSCVMYGIKRGLYSNEAGVGSAPNAAAAANVSHPVKQGLVQMLSVFIDTLVLCTATGIMILSAGVADADSAGVLAVQQSMATVCGDFGFYVITACLILFGFTTLIGNLFYAEANLKYLAGSSVNNSIMNVFRALCVIIIAVGATLDFGFVWDLADVLMGFMCLINLPVILILGKQAIAALNDYKAQLKEGKDPEFKASSIGLEGKIECWK